MIVVKHKDTSLNIKGRFVKYIQTIGVLDKDYLLIRTFKWLQKIDKELGIVLLYWF